MEDLRDFLNNLQEKFVCTASKHGEPSICLMGTTRISESGSVEFEISNKNSLTLKNITESKFITFMAYLPGLNAAAYTGVKIYAEVTDIQTSGDKINLIRERIRSRSGDKKADELQATVSCRINKLRPIVDHGQIFNLLPYRMVTEV